MRSKKTRAPRYPVVIARASTTGDRTSGRVMQLITSAIAVASGTLATAATECLRATRTAEETPATPSAGTTQARISQIPIRLGSLARITTTKRLVRPTLIHVENRTACAKVGRSSSATEKRGTNVV